MAIGKKKKKSSSTVSRAQHSKRSGVSIKTVSHRGKPAARSSSLSFFFLFIPAMQLYTNQLSLEAILSPTTLELILPLSPYKPPVNQSSSQDQKVGEPHPSVPSHICTLLTHLISSNPISFMKNKRNEIRTTMVSHFPQQNDKKSLTTHQKIISDINQITLVRQ
jgi:hypothetical protein